ncbi:MAG: ATPase V [Crenarchaeota archaeon]|nr:ATPase V [Thermoproteota archaeon]
MSSTQAKVLIVGDKYTVYTFRLLGFDGVIAEKADEVMKILEDVKDRDDIGVVLVTSNLVNQIRDYFNRLRLKLTKKIIMEIPTLREVKYEAVDYLSILRSALGI